ncbi:HAMP domain-containing histidine kinase [Alteromonas sp. 5E99-2]|nr:HAMP domain-containing histidine kinase [Alteromonas sp. 5E99-2]
MHYTKNVSFKSITMWVTVSIISMTIIVSAILSLNAQLLYAKNQAQSELNTIGNIVIENISDDLVNDNNDIVTRRLASLVHYPNVTNAHVYRVNNIKGEHFYTSFNRAGQASVESKLDQLEQLINTTFTDNIAELVFPVIADKKKVGYLYLRLELNEKRTIVRKVLIDYSIAYSAIMLLWVLITLKLQSIFITPIKNILSLLRKMNLTKDYSQRVKRSNFLELDILVTAINSMIDRFEELINKQLNTTVEYKALNTNLEEMVNDRTEALKDANNQLIQTLEKLHQFQRQIVQNEKMASLGDMVAGIAHEVNTPVGLGVTASTMMLDRLIVIKEQFETRTLKASSMAQFIDEGEENLNIIYRNLNRAAELISSFKQVAVDQTSEIDRVVNIKQLLDDIILSLGPQIKKTNHKLIVKCDDALNVKTKAGPINQIVINLVINSLIHAFEKGTEGKIELIIEKDGPNTVQMVFRDNGIGIPKNIKKRIFDPFVTTKRGQGGSGLGMHLVYNLVTQALNGSIVVTSEEGKGVEFTIMFPVKST